MPPIIDKIESRHRNIKDNIPEWIIVHHSAADAKQTFASIKNYHVNERGFDTIGYQYLITYDGTIYQGRPDLMHGAHCKEEGMNKKSIGICLTGNFDKFLPLPAQIVSLKSLLRAKMALYNVPLSKVVPHRHFLSNPPYKSCFGSRLVDDWAQDLISENGSVVIPPVIPEDKFTGFTNELKEAVDKLIKKWKGL